MNDAETSSTAASAARVSERGVQHAATCGMLAAVTHTHTHTHTHELPDKKWSDTFS